MDDLFRDDNTTGYTRTELTALNAEWADRSVALEPGSDEYYSAEKQFADEVAKR